MRAEEIRYGLRRYPLFLVLFGVFGGGFVWRSQLIERPTYVFPFGELDAPTARLVMLGIGAVSFLYLGIQSYIRFVTRPVVAIRKSEIAIPIGEFAGRTIVLHRGDVLAVREEGPRRGGWRTCHVDYRGGTLAVQSSRLPSDDAFFRVRDAIRALIAT